MPKRRPKAKSTTEWCDGLPLRTIRPLAPNERRDLRRERVRYLLKGWSLLLPLPVFFFVALAALALMEPPTTGPVWQLFAVLMLAVVVLLAWVATLGLESRMRSRKIRRDLKSAAVKEFVRADLATPPADELIGEPERFEVLAGSGRLWSVDGERFADWKIKQTTSVADTPEFAAVAAQWLEPVPNSVGVDVESGSRELAPSEIEEIRRHARASWRRPFWLTLGLSVWFWPLAVAMVWTRRGPDGIWNWVTFAWLGAITLRMDSLFARGVIHARALRRDARAGRVIMLRFSGDIWEGQEPKPTDVEILPESRVTWTEGQQPAAWRTHVL